MGIENVCVGIIDWFVGLDKYWWNGFVLNCSWCNIGIGWGYDEDGYGISDKLVLNCWFFCFL